MGESPLGPDIIAKGFHAPIDHLTIAIQRLRFVEDPPHMEMAQYFEDCVWKRSLELAQAGEDQDPQSHIQPGDGAAG